MWINPTTQQNYLSHSDIRAAFPQMSMPAELSDTLIAELDLRPLTATSPPVHDPATQAVSRDGCELVGGQWQYRWRIDALSADQIAASQAATAATGREAAKQARAAAVEHITVTTAAGNTFDGDETSQSRMARSVLVLSTGAAASVPWVLADNTVIQATAAELTEALALAGAEQARLWGLP